MEFKILCLLVVCLYYFTPTSAKPTNSVGLKQGDDLSEKFIEFLEQDKQFQALFSKLEDHDGFIRQKRQTINAMEDDEDDMIEAQKPKDGFMDRAAKFVMELLQRFLKWINTE